MTRPSDTSREAVERIRKYVGYRYTTPDTLLIDSELVKITAGDLIALLEERDEAADRIEALTAERDALREAATEAAKQLRIIAGMDLIGASATAYNAARDLEATLSRKATP